MSKISVIGAGQVGATAAQGLLRRRLGEVVLLDVNEGLAVGKALDMAQSAGLEGLEGEVVGGSDYQLITGSALVIVTAGYPRNPGMSRQQLLEKNAEIVRSVVDGAVRFAPGAAIMIVTNPLDLMVHLALKVSGYDKRLVFGMGSLLDSARYRYFMAKALGAPTSNVEGMVIGAHDDTMVPLVSRTTLRGKLVLELLADIDVSGVVDRTKKGGAEIISHLKSASAFYAPAASVVRMAEAFFEKDNREAVLPVCTLAEGEYGLSNVCVGLPVKLGRQGVVEIVKMPISDSERTALEASAASLSGGSALLKV